MPFSHQDATYLSDKYTFHQVSSTAVLASGIKNEKSVEDIAIFGGIKFDAKEDEIATNTNQSHKRTRIYHGLYDVDATRAGKWTYLDGTLQEAKNIDGLAKEIHISSKLYSGTGSWKNILKTLAVYPSVIHIATHGFFLIQNQINKK